MNITKAAVIATGHIFGTDQRTVKHLQKFDTFAMPFLIIVIMIRDDVRMIQHKRIQNILPGRIIVPYTGSNRL